MREPSYSGKDAIAGTPTKREQPANRPVGGLPDAKVTQQEHPRRKRRGG